MKALRFRLPLNSNSELEKTELLSAVPSELSPLPLNLGRIEANNSISEGLRLLLAPPPDFPTFLRLYAWEQKIKMQENSSKNLIPSWRGQGRTDLKC